MPYKEINIKMKTKKEKLIDTFLQIVNFATSNFPLYSVRQVCKKRKKNKVVHTWTSICP